MTTAINKNNHNWAMLAVNWYDLDWILYPAIIQPKLNGVRAMWNGRELVSRQGKIIPQHVLPEIYNKLLYYPNHKFDGELYCHGLRFQEIAGIVNGSRLKPHELAGKLDLHVFDIISKKLLKDRLQELHNLYEPAVPWCLVMNKPEVMTWLKIYIAAGYEGAMIRTGNPPYRPGRTEGLIKLKPLHNMEVRIMSFIEGKGKFKGMLGALIVENNKIQFKVGGGHITEKQRETLWQNQKSYKDKLINIQYRELSKGGIPLQPQIVSC